MEQEVMENENTLQHQEKFIQQVSAPLYSAKSWIKFLGITLIIGGVLYALTIVGILFAWIPIWLGILLVGAANKLDMAYLSGDKYSFINVQKKIGLYFTIYGVLMLISLILLVIFFGVLFATGMFSQLMDYFQNQSSGGFY